MLADFARLFILLFVGSSFGSAPPETTSLPPSPAPLACSCNYSQVWLDVVFLFDASAITGDGGLGYMWGFVQNTLTNFNVQRADYTGTNYSTRVGLVTYGNKGYVYKPLGSVNNADLADIEQLPYNNEPLSNLEDGIYVAASQLSGPNARRNARHVIVTLTTIYKPDGVDPPQPTATNFKGNGGILIMWDTVPAHAVASQTLEELASPGYYFSNTLNSSSYDLMQAFCDVNCFCYPQYLPYTMSQRRSPTDGCYLGVPVTGTFQTGKQKCALAENNGFLAISQSADKSSFLASRLPAGSSYYIGLTYDNIASQWIWPDGSALGSYAPWQSGSPTDGSNSRTCAYVNRDREWVSTDCRNGYYRICEFPACDSMHYCT